MSGTLNFEKISRYDRIAEPVSVSVPLARGRLADAAQLSIGKADGHRYPLQRHVLARWDDGTIKWLQVHWQPDLPGNADMTVQLRVSDAGEEPAPQQRVSVEETADGLRVDTGPLAFSVPRRGYLPITNVVLDGQALWGESPFSGISLVFDDVQVSSAEATVELTVEEAGPLRAVIAVRGKHRKADGSEYLGLRGRITAYAGKPYVEVEHQFIHDEAAEQHVLRSAELRFSPGKQDGAQVALGEGYYQTRISESDDAVEMLLDAETMLYQSNEHFIDSFYGDFWADWRDAQAGLTVSIYQAHQHFPKALRADREGIVCSLYPEGELSAPVLRGMAKTHRVLLHFHGAETPLQDLSVRSLQFQLPDVPALPRSWYRDNNPWLETFFPERLPNKLLSYFLRMHDGRPKALGMLHFGDAPDAGYTNQGRGRGRSVWVNNEYDRPHNCMLLYGLTGERRVHDSALVSARHWLDVDLVHYDPDPLVEGGLRIHTAYHATGGVTPSHEWVEGLLDYYFLTGRSEGLEAARSVAANIMRHMAQPRMMTPGQASVREGGWALRAMVGMYLGTGDEIYRAEAKRLVDLYVGWLAEYGGLLAPYTSHSMPRVVFMISLTVDSFARYLLIADDQRVKDLIVRTADDLVEHSLGPDGVPYYKELPSLRRSAPTPHFLAAMTHAYRLTGNDSYMKLAARCFAAMDHSGGGAESGPKFLDESGAVIAGSGGGRIFSSVFPSVLLFASEAVPAGFLDWFEYPY